MNEDDRQGLRAHVTQRTGEVPNTFEVVVPLWTTGGFSESALQLTLVGTAEGSFDVEINGLVSMNASTIPDPDLELMLPDSLRDDLPEAVADVGPISDRWRPVLESLVHRLVIGDYTGLAADGLVSYTTDPTDASVGQWIEDYPATLVDLPEEAWALAECFPNANDEKSWSVIVDLWTAEEGRSDLSMEATVWDDGTTIIAKVDYVHVM